MITVIMHVDLIEICINIGIIDQKIRSTKTDICKKRHLQKNMFSMICDNFSAISNNHDTQSRSLPIQFRFHL